MILQGVVGFNSDVRTQTWGHLGYTVKCTWPWSRDHHSVQGPRVSKNGLNTFLFIAWNSSCDLQNRLLYTILMVNPYNYFLYLSKVFHVEHYSHYDKTSKHCRPLRLQYNASKHTTNQRKTVHNIVTLVTTQRVAQTRIAHRLQTLCIHFLLNSTS